MGSYRYHPQDHGIQIYHPSPLERLGGLLYRSPKISGLILSFSLGVSQIISDEGMRAQNIQPDITRDYPGLFSPANFTPEYILEQSPPHMGVDSSIQSLSYTGREFSGNSNPTSFLSLPFEEFTIYLATHRADILSQLSLKQILDALKRVDGIRLNELDKRGRIIVQLLRDGSRDVNTFGEELYRGNQILYYQNLDLLLGTKYQTISDLLLGRIIDIEKRSQEEGGDCMSYDPESHIQRIESYLGEQENSPNTALIGEQDIIFLKQAVSELRNKIKDCSTDV